MRRAERSPREEIQHDALYVVVIKMHFIVLRYVRMPGCKALMPPLERRLVSPVTGSIAQGAPQLSALFEGGFS